MGPAPELVPAPAKAPQVDGSPLLNTDSDANYVESGDDGSKRLKVEASVGFVVLSAPTLPKALQREAIHT